MVTVTEQAAAQIKRVLAAWGVPEEMALRVRSSGSDLTLQFDTREPGDHVVMHGKQVILVFEEPIGRQLDGMVIDLHPSSSGGMLELVHGSDPVGAV